MLREIELVSIILRDGSLLVQIHFFTIGIFIIILLLIWLLTDKTFQFFNNNKIEIEKAELGLGGGTITIKPNNKDRQVAYSIWVELSTRKIGLPIDLEDDVIIEIYNSWYEFFKITRELIKDVPATQIKSNSTQAIVNLSIEILNEGIRPHLGKWQARFRHWYEAQLAINPTDIDPQELQKKYPHYKELQTEMRELNNNLISYRSKMYELVRS
jgi:hypothetical protein